MTAINLLFIGLLLIATAFFVAAEFAYVKVRTTRIDQLALEGNKKAIAVQRITSNLDGYLSACQLGITITALGLGWLGESTIEKLLHPLFASLGLPEQVTGTISLVFAFSLVTFLHVVLGELAPKSVAIQKSEALSLALSGPMVAFYRILYPIIWVLNGSAAVFIKLLGFRPVKEHEEAHSEEELRIILTESFESGEINQAEYGYVSRIFDFDELKAREIMVPRTDMVCLYADRPIEENLKIMRDEQYTRFPVANENKDNIIGMIHTKQFFFNCTDNNEVNFTSLIRPVMSVSESMPVKTLLKEMQRQNMHIAVLVDEYGGTAGMVTIEDILEEIVGEIRDEFDEEEVPELEKINDQRIIVDGKAHLSEVVDFFGTELQPDDFDSIGGWLYAHNSALKEGEPWAYGDLIFVVKKKDRHRYRKIDIVRSPLGEGEAEREERETDGTR
ncbi:hemolysin family protein [Paenibacillus turpanensis]|uniref:hemolysin family protein n=1 Tax=Paenibacillus turpanensis TaxID=2689078 RepID=UPI00140BF3CB|nr:hemolysin family protein [Paenibacillus turpanensis]